MMYLGILLDFQSFRALPDQKRFKKLLSVGDEFLSCEEQPISSWLELLQVLSSIIPLVPGGCLSLQLQLLSILGSPRPVRSGAVDLNLSARSRVVVVRSRLEEGVSLSQVFPTLASGPTPRTWVGGAHLGDGVASDLWSLQERDLSINARELLAVERVLLHFALQLANSTFAVFADNSTAVAYLHNQGGTRSPLLNSIAQQFLRWAESVPLTLFPQFIMGKNNVLVDALSLSTQSNPGFRVDSETGSVPGSAETLAGDDRPLSHLVESPMFTIFFAIPLSECSVLASAALVSGTYGSRSERSSSSSFVL